MAESSTVLAPKLVEGATASVEFMPDRVIMTTALGSTPGGLNKKIENQKLFDEITSDIRDLYHPKILVEDALRGRYEIERATGFNLTSAREQTHGSMTDFFGLGTEFKFVAMGSYLKAIDLVDKAGYCFVDHKPDSVFIDPVKWKVAIVDTDGLIKQDRGVWEREISGGLKNVLEAFFTRGLNDDAGDLIPNYLSRVLNNLDKYKSMVDVRTAIINWSVGREPAPSDTQRFLKITMEMMARMNPKMLQKVQEMNFSTATSFEIEMMEAEIKREIYLMYGEPQAIDKYVFGIK